MARQINKRKLILLWYLLQGIVLIICFFCVRYGKHELKSPIDSLVIGSILTASSIIGLYTNHKWVVFVDFVIMSICAFADITKMDIATPNQIDFFIFNRN